MNYANKYTLSINLKLIAALALAILFFGLMGGSASAGSGAPGTVPSPTSQMPYPGDFERGGEIKLLLTRAGPGTLLQSPWNNTRIYSPNKDVDIHIFNGARCKDDNSLEAASDVTTRYDVYPLDAVTDVNQVGSSDGYYYKNGIKSSTPWVDFTKNSIWSGDDAKVRCVDYTIRLRKLPPSSRVPLNAQGTLKPYAGLYAVQFEGQITGGHGFNFYWLSAPGAKISYYDSDWTATLSSNGTSPRPGPAGDYRLGFAPGCTLDQNAPRRNYRLTFHDLDAGLEEQGYENPVKADVYEYNKNGVYSGGNWHRDFYKYGSGGESTTYNWDIPVKGGHKYVVVLRHIYESNGIQYRLPGDSFNNSIDCFPDGPGPGPTPPRVDQNCTTFTYGGAGSPIAKNSKFRFHVYSRAGRGGAFTPAHSYANGKKRANGPANESDWGTAPGQVAQPYLQTGDSPNATWPFNYPQDRVQGPDWEVAVERWQNTGAAGANKWQYTYRINPSSYLESNCYSAACTIKFFGTIPNRPSGVEAGKNFPAEATIYNTGRMPLPNNIAGNGLAITNANGPPVPLAYAGNPSPIPAGWPGNPGALYTLDFQVPAPGAIGRYPLSGYSDYYGRFGLGPVCGAATFVDVYQHFNIQPKAGPVSGNPTDENPTTVNWQTGGYKTEPPDVTATASSWLTRDRYGSAQAIVQGIINNAHVYGTPPDDMFSYPNSDIRAGDNYCAHVTISPAVGWAGPDGDIVPLADSTANSGSCLKVVNEPYVHTFGSDVSAGGGFGANCTTKHGGINGFVNNTGMKPTGSGVQIGALSIDRIEGFGSAILRQSTPTGSAGLSFSNENVSSGSGSPGLGGNLGGTHCVPNYFDTKPPDTSENKNTLVGGGVDLPDGYGNSTQYYNPGGSGTGTLTINRTTLGNATNIVIYVSGNVHIAGDIKYRNPNWDIAGSISKIPSLYIITKGGSISIDPGVKQLDGMYVSQPANTDGSGPGGNIYTCGDAVGSPIAYKDLIPLCQNQLVVNGAFVAQHVWLLRSFGSLRNSYPGERLNATRPASSPDCTDSGPAQNGECAAEIFNFSPELYLAQPSLPPSSGPSTGKYEYITSLSPVL